MLDIMKRSPFFVFFSVFVAALAAPAFEVSIGRADDSPQWGERFTRNLVSNEHHLPDRFVPGRRDAESGLADPATTRNVLWTASIGEVIYGTPVIAEGCVFIGSNESRQSNPKLHGDRGVLSCLDEKTGRLLWELVVPKLTEIKYADWYRVGICSPPVVEDGRIYLITNRCDVLCLDIRGLKNGNQGPFVDEAAYAVAPGTAPIELDVSPDSLHADILWRCNLIEELGVMPHNACNCSVLIDGNVLYACTGNGVDWTHRRVQNPEAPTLVALDKRDGLVLAVDQFGMGPNIIHGQWSSPALGTVAGRRIVVQGTGSGWLFAVDALAPEQVEQLRQRSEEGRPPFKLNNVWRFNGHPAAQTQDVVPLEHHQYSKSYEVVGNPVFLDDRIYVVFTQELFHNVHHGRVVCIDAKAAGEDITRNGLRWAYDDMSSSSSTVCVADGLVYVSDNRGRLHCLDAESGKIAWVHNLQGHGVWSSPLLADGKLHIGTGRRIFWILKHGRTAEIVSRTTMPGPIYASCAAANGILYVPVFGTLYALKNLE